MTLVGSLLSAMSGLRTTQAALQINANNIANVNTEGYTRKTASQETPIVGGAAHGVELGDVHRTVDQNLLRQIRTHIARLSGQQVQNDFLTRTQSLFGTPGSNTSLSHNLASLGSAFEAFALAPFYLNFFEDPATAQFDHRILALLTLALVLILWFSGRRTSAATTSSPSAK